MKLRGLVPDSYIHVSMRDIYIPRIGLPIWLQKNGQTDTGNIHLLQIYPCGSWETELYNSVLEITIQFHFWNKSEPDILTSHSSAVQSLINRHKFHCRSGHAGIQHLNSAQITEDSHSAFSLEGTSIYNCSRRAPMACSYTGRKGDFSVQFLE
jgi:hypothetical protein